MFDKVRHHHLLQCAAFLALLLVVFAAMSPQFLTLINFSNIVIASTVIGLMALGATFVIGSGGIDLSTAAVMALASVVAASICQQHPDLSAWFIVAIALLTGGVVGALNGLLVNITAAPSFIITLGMMSVARALSYIVSNGMPVYGLPESTTVLAQGAWLGVPGVLWFTLAGLVISATLLAFTRFGRWTLIMGDNAAAAGAMGIPLNAQRIKIYALAGALAGLAGFVFMARTNSGDPSAGQNYELMAITAVILGGANLFGGKASIAGTVLGILCLGVLQNGLNLLAISTFYQVLFIGLVLLAASFLRRKGQS